MDTKYKVKITEAKKLISALYELSKENFSVSDDTVLDKLYVHIHNSGSLKGVVEDLLPEIGVWLEVVLNHWNNSEIFYGVQIFTIRFIGYIGSSLKGFEMLKGKYVLDHIQNLFKRNEIQNDSCLMVPLINILGQFSEHHEGWKWVTETMVWKHILKVLDDNRSIYIKRSGVKFISLLLRMSIEYDNNTGKEILCDVCELLISNHLIVVETYNNFTVTNELPNKSTFSGENVTAFAQLNRAAQNVCDILEDLLSTIYYIPWRLSLVFRTLNDNDESVIAKDILQRCSSAQDHETYSILLLMVDFSNVFRSHSQECTVGVLYQHTYWVIKSMVFQGHFNAVINFSVICLSLWTKFLCKENCCPLCDQHFECFESTILYCLRTFLHLHLYSCSKNGTLCNPANLFGSKIKSEEVSFEKAFFQKIDHDYLSSTGEAEKISFNFIQMGVLAITRSLKFITKRKNIEKLFSEILYTLDSIVRSFHNNQDLSSPVLLHLLTLTSKIIEAHRLPFWIENEEDNSENLFTVIIKILSIEHCDVRVTIITLQVLSKVLRFHVLPDLLCKSELMKGIEVKVQLCSMSILKSKLNSQSWEIRDTTLEVFHTLIDMSELTPWFFLNLFQSDWLTKILQLGMDDKSAYVRASALNFFSRTVRSRFFANLMSPTTLFESATKLLIEDEMPVVRRAACELITALYITFVPKVVHAEDAIYDILFTTTLKDLDWEVKKAALQFWQCVINKHFMDEMIPMDSSFLYFSKNPVVKEETTVKIMSVMNILGKIGCLKAIWLGVSDDCDLKVSQEAGRIVNNLEELDQKWNFVDRLYTFEDNLEEEGGNGGSHKGLTPKDFFSLIRQQDWRKRLNSRSDWIENSCDDLTSLLDHILNIDNRMDDWDHNAVDCY